jgi:hypothetical protein
VGANRCDFALTELDCLSFVLQSGNVPRAKFRDLFISKHRFSNVVFTRGKSDKFVAQKTRKIGMCLWKAPEFCIGYFRGEFQYEQI